MTNGSFGTIVDVQEVHEPVSGEQLAKHAANPALNPLPASTFIVSPSEPSRLAAGSTLEVSPGLHVAHPHAEVNLPGRPDPRTVVTDALTETLEGKQRPLAEEVRPKTVTVEPGGQVVKATIQKEPSDVTAASSQEIKVVVEDAAAPTK